MQAFKAVAVCTDDAANVRLVSLADGDTEYVLGRAMQASGGKGFACYVLPEEAVRSHTPKKPRNVTRADARNYARLSSGVVQGWRACPHAQPGCPTRGAPPAAARAAPLTYSLTTSQQSVPRLSVQC
jgi:hypothetical protein